MILKLLAGAGAGGLLGAAMGYFGSCTSGTCPLTSSPWRGALFGGLLGLALVLTFTQGCGTATQQQAAGDPPGGGPAAAAESRVVEIARDADFQEKVEDAKGVVLADFHANWCGYCRRLAPTIDRLSGEYAGKAAFVRIDVDDHKGLARRFDVQGLPTLILFKDGKPVRTLVGYRDAAELKAELDKQLGT
jgi:thioredoxin 1